MGLMNLLAELHAEPDLKLNLKFEIEVLCKHLQEWEYFIIDGWIEKKIAFKNVDFFA